MFDQKSENFELIWKNVSGGKIEAIARRCSLKKVFFEISQNSQENSCPRVSFLIKLQASACKFINKDTLTQVFFCEICEISQNTFSYRTAPVIAFGKMQFQRVTKVKVINSKMEGCENWIMKYFGLLIKSKHFWLYLQN